ncbi:MAG TPA: protein-disulfide reductase DsbD domain-containing protein [Chitinophagaceae bacterium]|nr:protein-disulfide reductase DsbD domain-containing protein [Chitinophagaceae bacterium]
MKKLYLLGCLVMAGLAVTAQSSKAVHWTFTSKKVADKVYEVHMTASIDGNYHMYAQNAGVDGPIPTSFKFVANPLAVVDGKVKEVGKLVKKKEEVWGGDVLYYERTVDFVQVVKLKGKVKTNMAGTVSFMVCNESQCLPPADVDFKVNIGG